MLYDIVFDLYYFNIESALSSNHDFFYIFGFPACPDSF